MPKNAQDLRARAREDEQHPHLGDRGRPRARTRSSSATGLLELTPALHDATFWLGGYGPRHGMGRAEGIGLLAGDEGREAKHARLPRCPSWRRTSPSWLAQHPSLDVRPTRRSKATQRLQAFVRTVKGCSLRWAPPRRSGQYVCHVAVAPERLGAGRQLATATAAWCGSTSRSGGGASCTRARCRRSSPIGPVR